MKRFAFLCVQPGRHRQPLDSSMLEDADEVPDAQRTFANHPIADHEIVADQHVRNRALAGLVKCMAQGGHDFLDAQHDARMLCRIES